MHDSIRQTTTDRTPTAAFCGPDTFCAAAAAVKHTTRTIPKHEGRYRYSIAMDGGVYRKHRIEETVPVKRHRGAGTHTVQRTPSVNGGSPSVRAVSTHTTPHCAKTKRDRHIFWDVGVDTFLADTQSTTHLSNIIIFSRGIARCMVELTISYYRTVHVAPTHIHGFGARQPMSTVGSRGWLSQ